MRNSVKSQPVDAHEDMKLAIDNEQKTESSSEQVTSSNQRNVNNNDVDRPMNERSIMSVESMASKVFDYSFIVQLTLDYLTDRDVLINLILTSRAVNRSVSRYPIKLCVDKHLFDRITQSGLKTLNRLQNNEHVVSNNARLIFTSASCRDLFSVERAAEVALWLPISVTKLSMIVDKELVAKDVPSHITDLTVELGSSILSIRPGVLHEGIKHLRTNHILCHGSIPSSVETLDWKLSYNDIDISVIPDTVREIFIHERCRRSKPFNLSGVIPSSVTKLVIHGDLLFKSPCVVGSIPSSIKDLTIDLCEYSTNSQRTLSPGFFPDSLTRLCIRGTDGACLFPSISQSNNQTNNQSIQRSRVIPDTVIELIFRTDFSNGGRDLQVGDLLPSLRVLDLGGYIGRLYPGVLPSTLHVLTMNGNNHGELLEPNVIPYGVTDLCLLSHKSYKASHKRYAYQAILPGVIPSSVISLEWNYEPTDRTLTIGSVPSSVKTFVFGPTFRGKVPIGFIPDSVRSLTFGDAFITSSPLKVGVIPSGVKYLRFGRLFDNAEKPIKAGVIPETVTHLYFDPDSMFNGRLGGLALRSVFPPSVMVLQNSWSTI